MSQPSYLLDSSEKIIFNFAILASLLLAQAAHIGLIGIADEFSDDFLGDVCAYIFEIIIVDL
jgi:hypothetical protein